MQSPNYDPYAYEIHEDPYPVYRDLREAGPVYRNADLDFWALTRHQDVLAAFKNWNLYSNREGVSIDPSSRTSAAEVGMSFLAMDPPRHSRVRRLVSQEFTPRRVAALEDRIRTLTKSYLDPLVSSGGFDVIADFAGLLPMAVISELLGVPEADRAVLRTWADLLVHREEGVRDVPSEGKQAFVNIRSYFTDLVADLRAHPNEGLLSALLEMERDGNGLEEGELLSVCNLMITAGNETTTKLLANALYWLSENPSQREVVHNDSSQIEAWIEETLRYDNSTQMLARLMTEETRIHDHVIPAGGLVLLLVGSANRDEAVFPNADQYQIGRDTSQMLSFGKGMHFCLGASLARLEARVAFEEWWKRFPNYELEMESAERVHSVNVRGFSRLPVRV